MKFIDLFAGIGGFHLAFHGLGHECVFASEIDKNARITYEANLSPLSPELFESGLYNDDIRKITEPASQIPDFDILCAGFPCQPFSQAGFKKGFNEDKDDRGNMFFSICSIIESKRPKAFFLENVRGLLKHDDGRTFKIIQNHLESRLGYTFDYKVVKASDHGLPQHRPRVYIVGFRKDVAEMPKFEFPDAVPLKMTMSDIWEGNCPKEIGYTLRVGGKGSGLHDRRNWDAYLVDGVERRLTPVEGVKMMGFPPDFQFPVSTTQAMKQLGNSVAVNAVSATALSIVSYLEENADLFIQPNQLDVA
ncbi:MAG: DNA (cytosine-5)-methyltransferase 1 [Cocleimonas sp.]|jgi:DNA (cytosine-5)-methyltransferase 1